MGLLLVNLTEIPNSLEKEYYIYLLDTDWEEPLNDALKKNFEKMTEEASKAGNIVIIKQNQFSDHFSDEVFSWHNINKNDVSQNILLPAILIANKHPNYFKENKLMHQNDFKTIIFPLKKYCKSPTDVTELIQNIFRNIKEGTDFIGFEVSKENKKGIGKAIFDSIILEPNISGIGFSFNKFREYFKTNK